MGVPVDGVDAIDTFRLTLAAVLVDLRVEGEDGRGRGGEDVDDADTPESPLAKSDVDLSEPPSPSSPVSRLSPPKFVSGEGSSRPTESS